MAGTAQLPSEPAVGANGTVTCDVAIVGAGVAGLFAAVRLADGLDVVVIDKGEPDAGSSPLAQGGLAAAVGPGDTPQQHAQDTVRAGDGLCDPAAVEILTREAPDRVADLLRLGAELDRGGPGRRGLHLAREGGHAVARSVHRADATGAELVRVLRAAAAPGVHRLPGLAVALACPHPGAVAGVWVLAQRRPVLVRAKATLLATGGCGGLFAATTNRRRATGDGVVLAWRAGAAVRDLEFVQFHPTGLAVGDGFRLLITEALRGAGATLHDQQGRRFMPAVHPDAELAPRHVVAEAVLRQQGGAWLDATGVGSRRLEAEFPTVLAGARRHGFEPLTERLPVTPAAHYAIGGVRTDLRGRTSLGGLYAAGEVAATGVHGADRLAGNSLAEAVVFGARAADTITTELPPTLAGPGPEPDLSGAVPDGAELLDVRERLRATMWEGAGPVRTARSLERADRRLRELAGRLGPASTEPGHAELCMAVEAAGLVVTAAALRAETRGVHRREDAPQRGDHWEGGRIERVRG